MFNAKEEVEKIIKFIRDYYEKNKLEGVVLGISGGKDSAIVAALFVEALGNERVVGVTLPCHSKEEDKIDAKMLSEYYGFRLYNIDLTEMFDAFKNNLQDFGKLTEDDVRESDINLKSRLRMSSLYYVARLISDIHKKVYLVAGTSNKSELFVGYFTKGGDSVHDIAVLADFHVSEAIKIGEYLQVPEKILYKTPSDGLSGKSDEEKMQVSYEDIEKYETNQGSISTKSRMKIKKMHETSFHKFNIPTYRRK